TQPRSTPPLITMTTEFSAGSSLARMPILSGSSTFPKWQLAIKGRAMLMGIWPIINGKKTRPTHTTGDDEDKQKETVDKQDKWDTDNEKAIGLILSTTSE